MYALCKKIFPIIGCAVARSCKVKPQIKRTTPRNFLPSSLAGLVL
ncbi:Hypothetical protein Cp262_2180 [Corynebacterium pseudotuberculosis]|nr:hypothetical protein CPTB_01552 [Corynebacterium pseudotuberculosis]ARX64285.1 Hypothetical protein Cp262_2180 [Corynebacterium pseudotuberculosis]KEX88140.1 hypothetical protein CPTD_01779 [Corynebacterium pseudotuberculosis]